MDDDDEVLAALEKVARYNRAVRVLNIAHAIVIAEQRRISNGQVSPEED